MFKNSVLYKQVTTSAYDDHGFKKPTFEDDFNFDVDAQPYSDSLAQKDYGLADKGIEFRCYTENTALSIEKGDHFKKDGSVTIYICVFSRKWENHIVFVLKRVDYFG